MSRRCRRGADDNGAVAGARRTDGDGIVADAAGWDAVACSPVDWDRRRAVGSAGGAGVGCAVGSRDPRADIRRRRCPSSRWQT